MTATLAPAPGDRVRIVATLASGYLGTLIGPEAHRVTVNSEPVPGWWIRLDTLPAGPFAGALGWYEAAWFELVDGA